MELKVWVEGIQRVICGVNQNTTSQDVIVALAQATGKTGRFTLIEQWRDNEHLLAPGDNPLRVLQKYGEYANDVQFILRQSESDSGSKKQFTHNFSPPPPHGGAVVKRNLTFSGAHHSPTNGFPSQRHYQSQTPSHAIIEESDEGSSHELHPPKPKQPPPYYMVERMLHENIQKGRIIQQNGPSSHNSPRESPGGRGHDGEWQSSQGLVETHEFVVRNPEPRRGNTPENSYNSLERRHRRKDHSSVSSSNVSYNSLERKKRHRGSPQISSPYSVNDGSVDKRTPISFGADAYDISVTPENKHAMRISPERQSPMRSRRSPDGRSPPVSRPVKSRKELRERDLEAEEFDLERSLFEDDGVLQSQVFQEKVMAKKVSREQLLKLVSLQMQKMETQDSQMKTANEDLTVLENLERDFTKKMESLQADIRHYDIVDQQLVQEIAENNSIQWGDDIEVQKQTEKNLQAELALIRSKLTSCESEVLQCQKQRMQLADDISQEKQEQEEELRKEEERMKEKADHMRTKLQNVESEISRDVKQLEEIESEIQKQDERLQQKKQETIDIEASIKQANLQQFTKVKPEKHDKEEKSPRSNSPATTKLGSIRKMTGSPQLLGETVPTSRNPQGLWV